MHDKLELVEWIDHDGAADTKAENTPEGWVEYFGSLCRFSEVGYLIGESEVWILLAKRKRHDLDTAYDEKPEYADVQRILKATIVKRTRLERVDREVAA